MNEDATQKSTMKTEEDVVRKGGIVADNSSAAGVQGDVEEFPEEVLSPSDPDVEIVKVEVLERTTVAIIDPWHIVEGVDDGIHWKELKPSKKVWFVTWVNIRVLVIIASLYFFLCTLDILQGAFQLLAGRTASSVFANSVLINNPISALMVGVLVTVVVQSSSTSTSIVVSMVGSGLLTVKQGIPIVMGANIGTTITSTLVSLTQSGDRNVFRRAFACATVHVAEKWLTVLALLPLELATHYLYHLTGAITANISPPGNTSNPKFLRAVTSPLTETIIVIDPEMMTAIAHRSDKVKFPLAEYYCKQVTQNYASNLTTAEAELEYKKVSHKMFSYDITLTTYDGINMSQLKYTEILDANSTQCSFLFHCTGTPGCLSEPAAGSILLISSILVLTLSLLLMIKLLNSLIKGPIARIVRKAINADFPGCFRYLTGYVAMLVGLTITVIFHSSSLFISTLTPLVGIGVLTIERVYPLILGSNVGTTVTCILAALAGDPSRIQDTLHMAFCHLFFNITGILIYYPIPFMRIPIPLGKMIGNTTARYRWFSVAFLLAIFLVLPLSVFGLSLAGWYVLAAVGIPFLLLVAFVVIVNVLQNKKPNWLPRVLRTWNWLPKPMRSLEPYDRVFTACCRSKFCFCSKCIDPVDKETVVQENVPKASP